MKFSDNFVYGYSQLAELLGTSKGALYVAKHRGRLPIEPVGHIGLVAVFDREQVLALAAQRAKAAK